MYARKDFRGLIGMKGFSREMLENHFKLYEGYVEAANGLLADLAEARKARKATRASAELRRRLGWELNGMRLHEHYFENLGGSGAFAAEGRLGSRLAENFGDVAAWERDFRATGGMRGIGWAILCEDAASGQLLDLWIDEHDVGHVTGARPLLVLDVFEHAFLLDYGIRKDDYIDAFLANVDWNVVESRLA